MKLTETSLNETYDYELDDLLEEVLATVKPEDCLPLKEQNIPKFSGSKEELKRIQKQNEILREGSEWIVYDL